MFLKGHSLWPQPFCNSKSERISAKWIKVTREMFSKRFSLIFTKAIFIFPRLCHKLKTKNKIKTSPPFVRRKKRGRERRDCTQKHSFKILIPAKVSRLPGSRQPQLEPKVCKCLISHSLGCDGTYSYGSCYHLTGQNRCYSLIFLARSSFTSRKE